METQNMKALVLALCLAVFVGTCWAHGPEPSASVTDPAAPAVNAVKGAGNAVKDAATPAVNAASEAGNAAKDAATPAATAVRDATAPAAHAAAEKSESFAQWAYDKISSGFGLRTEDEKTIAQNAKMDVGEAATKAKDAVEESFDSTKHKVGEAYESAKKAATRENGKKK